MIGDEVRLIPAAVPALDALGMDSGIDNLVREVDQVLDMVCAWGDIGDAFRAFGEIFEFLECFADM